jgi:hypothetical protein
MSRSGCREAFEAFTAIEYSLSHESAFATDFRQPSDLVIWAVGEGATVPPAARWNVWQGTDVTTWSQLRDPVAKLCAFARAE